jgi:hypothetical protein
VKLVLYKAVRVLKAPRLVEEQVVVVQDYLHNLAQRQQKLVVRQAVMQQLLLQLPVVDHNFLQVHLVVQHLLHNK